MRSGLSFPDPEHPSYHDSLCWVTSANQRPDTLGRQTYERGLLHRQKALLLFVVDGARLSYCSLICCARKSLVGWTERPKAFFPPCRASTEATAMMDIMEGPTPLADS